MTTLNEKALAGILIAHGVLGVAWLYWVASNNGFPSSFLAQNLALAAAGISAGIGFLKKKKWSLPVGLFFYGVQILQIFTPTFQFSFSLGVNLNILAGWFKAGSLGVNLFALIMFLWFSRKAYTRIYGNRAIAA